MATIISADNLKETLPGYDPANSGEFHSVSAKMADKEYQRALRECPTNQVVLMAGGTASGKSEYVSTYLEHEDCIVLDGTLPTLSGAEIKIRTGERAGKTIEVRLVIPASFTMALMVFPNRERQFAMQHFFRTHSSARRTTLEVAERHPQVGIRIIESDVTFAGSGGTMRFREIEFNTRSLLIDFLRDNQYGESQILDNIIP